MISKSGPIYEKVIPRDKALGPRDVWITGQAMKQTCRAAVSGGASLQQGSVSVSRDGTSRCGHRGAWVCGYVNVPGKPTFLS